jgi:hypothetical protein
MLISKRANITRKWSTDHHVLRSWSRTRPFCKSGSKIFLVDIAWSDSWVQNALRHKPTFRIPHSFSPFRVTRTQFSSFRQGNTRDLKQGSFSQESRSVVNFLSWSQDISTCGWVSIDANVRAEQPPALARRTLQKEKTLSLKCDFYLLERCLVLEGQAFFVSVSRGIWFSLAC